MKIQEFAHGSAMPLASMPDGQVFFNSDGTLWMKTKDYGPAGLIMRLSDGHLDAVAPSNSYDTADVILEPLS